MQTQAVTMCVCGGGVRRWDLYKSSTIHVLQVLEYGQSMASKVVAS